MNGLMADPQLAALNLRHFDPTQAFTKDRVDKGLVESLMLKRAKCTVYSVQDTDTLGKDSELAATLAQGKPVIAYVPTVDVEHAKRPARSARIPATVQDRLRFVLYADDQFAQSVSRGRLRVRAQASGPSSSSRPTGSGGPRPTRRPSNSFRRARGDLARLCRIIAASEARIYDRRARTLSRVPPAGHPGEPGHRRGKRRAGRADHSAVRGFAQKGGDQRAGVRPYRNQDHVVS